MMLPGITFSEHLVQHHDQHIDVNTKTQNIFVIRFLILPFYRHTHFPYIPLYTVLSSLPLPSLIFL